MTFGPCFEGASQKARKNDLIAPSCLYRIDFSMLLNSYAHVV